MIDAPLAEALMCSWVIVSREREGGREEGREGGGGEGTSKHSPNLPEAPLLQHHFHHANLFRRPPNPDPLLLPSTQKDKLALGKLQGASSIDLIEEFLGKGTRRALLQARTLSAVLS